MFNSKKSEYLPHKRSGWKLQPDPPIGKDSKGEGMTINVEYNQLDPLLKTTPAGGDVADASGFSPYPGRGWDEGESHSSDLRKGRFIKPAILV